MRNYRTPDAAALQQAAAVWVVVIALGASIDPCDNQPGSTTQYGCRSVRQSLNDTSRLGDHVSTDKRDRNRRYATSGDGLKSIHEGFVAMCMREDRRRAALNIVSEVLAANNVADSDFRWYKLDSTNELVCYWVGQPTNVLWVTTAKVHMSATRADVNCPARPFTWKKKDGEYAGWKLDEVEPGSD